MEWIFMIVVWATVEFIQFLRKKPFPARMKAGAWWAVIVGALADYGASKNPALIVFFISLGISGVGAIIFYRARIWVANLWAKSKLRRTPS